MICKRITTATSPSIEFLRKVQCTTPYCLTRVRNAARKTLLSVTMTHKASKQVISQQYINKPVVYCWFPARAVELLGDRPKFEDNFANTAITDSNILQ